MDQQDNRTELDYSELPRVSAPSRHLEDVIVRELVDRGLLRRRHGSWRSGILAVAASLTLFFAGYLVGTTSGGNDLSGTPLARFALFLHEGPSFQPAPPEDPDRHVRSYGAWAERLATQGALVTAAELDSVDWLLEPGTQAGEVSEIRGGTPSGVLSGFFIVTARDASEALRLASTHPHLASGGQVSVHGIVGR